MIRLRHIGTAAVAALLALALTACGGLPTSGPVNPGQQITDEEADSDFIFIPDGPAKNASPQQIVEGFIAAGSGASNSWAKAKEFLAPEFRDQWRPQAAVTVYAPGQRTLDEVTADEFQLTVTPVAAVDDTGELSVSADGGDIPLTYKLAEQSDGQWRITQAPDGVVLDRNRFTAVFGSYALQFFDLDWTYLIPDTRWFPKVSSATSIAEALVDRGPADWLKGSVATAFADGAQLAAAAVPVRANVAEVSLQDGRDPSSRRRSTACRRSSRRVCCPPTSSASTCSSTISCCRRTPSPSPPRASIRGRSCAPTTLSASHPVTRSSRSSDSPTRS